MAGCGSSGSTGPGTETKQTCTMTLGGAQSGSPACTVIGAIQTTSDGKTSLGFNGASADDSADVALFLPSAPVPGTYSNDNGGSAVILLQGTTTGWTAGGSTGSWSVTITSDSLVNSGAGLTRYRVHGSMSATLVQVSSGGADATLTVIF
jgi:hypothetical protein